jgi:putative tricarboxylic transport membrane protein
LAVQAKLSQLREGALVFVRLLSIVLTFAVSVSFASENYPSRPITVVVGFGVGGSADRMARAVSPKLAEFLGQPVQVINKKGAGTLLGANYVLSRPHDGHTLFASTFSPYLLNTVLSGVANYAIEDFAYLNFQWFDEDLIALSKQSKYRSLAELLHAIREQPKTVRASVVKGSAGHLMAKLLLQINGIPQQNLNLVTYNGGGKARAAVAGGVVDFIIISAKGSESIREYLRPLAIVSDQPSIEWQVPTLNQALAPLGLKAPVLPGSMRGFATSAEFRKTHPDRYQKLLVALRSTLEDLELQKQLEQADIGYRWIGSEKADALMHENYQTFDHYSHLLDWN